MIRKSNKQVTVELTYSWTFNEKDWDVSKEHMRLMEEHPSIVFGYDHISSWHNLNDVIHPELSDCSVKRTE
jgi:hypothetical protein